MGTKHTDRCLTTAGDDEPIFVLRAHDVLAPGLVRDWAQQARREGTPEAKCQEAHDCATAMETWQLEHGSKVPD